MYHPGDRHESMAFHHRTLLFCFCLFGFFLWLRLFLLFTHNIDTYHETIDIHPIATKALRRVLRFRFAIMVF